MQRDCPDCTNMPGPFELYIVNANGDNLLNPATESALEIDKMKFSAGQIMTYTITSDYMIRSTDPRILKTVGIKMENFIFSLKTVPKLIR